MTSDIELFMILATAIELAVCSNFQASYTLGFFTSGVLSDIVEIF